MLTLAENQLYPHLREQPADRRNALFLSFMRAMDCPQEGSPGSCPVFFFFSLSLSLSLCLSSSSSVGVRGHDNRPRALPCALARLACPIQDPEARCTRTLGQKGGRGKALRAQVLPDPPIPNPSLPPCSILPAMSFLASRAYQNAGEKNWHSLHDKSLEPFWQLTWPSWWDSLAPYSGRV